MHISRTFNYMRLIVNVRKVAQKYAITSLYSTSVDVLDMFTSELLQKHKSKTRNCLALKDFNIRYFTDTEINDVSQMTLEQIDVILLHLLTKNKDKQIEQMVHDCLEQHKFINQTTLKKLFRNYSITGKPESVAYLQQYCAKIDPNLYRRNGEFLHYLAKAQCMKGNSEKGLIILRDTYNKYSNLRSLYRIIFKELIQDSILNRSEASLVIFKKYVLYFSDHWGDHYPLICFWHLCWSSTWFSDQMTSEELLETSQNLQEIVRDKATAFSICILRDEYNEDAVMRLLQMLLKHNMVTEYVKVLQVLFNYKLRNRDMRGCQEIIRNCEVLGVSLPSNQQGKYIKLLIDGKPAATKQTDNFKLKF